MWKKGETKQSSFHWYTYKIVLVVSNYEAVPDYDSKQAKEQRCMTWEKLGDVPWVQSMRGQEKGTEIWQASCERTLSALNLSEPGSEYSEIIWKKMLKKLWFIIRKLQLFAQWVPLSRSHVGDTKWDKQLRALSSRSSSCRTQESRDSMSPLSDVEKYPALSWNVMPPLNSLRRWTHHCVGCVGTISVQHSGQLMA